MKAKVSVVKPMNKQAHTARSQRGTGDSYGVGYHNPLGKMREDSMGMVAVSSKKLKKPPRSLA